MPGSKRKEITAYAQLFAPEEHKYSEQTLMPNTEMDEIIALAQSITRKESPSKEPDSVSSPEMIITRARSFTREQNKSSEPTSNEDSDASLSSETENYIKNKATTQLSSLKEHQTRNMRYPMDK